MLNLKHLYYFHVFTKELSTSRAAKVLRISAPALSNQLKELEAYLGLKLTKRVKGDFVVTEYGQMVGHYADRMFAVYDELNSRIAVPASAVANFRVGISQYIGTAFSFDFLSLTTSAVLRDAKKIQLVFDSTEHLLEGFVNDEYDLLLGSFAAQHLRKKEGTVLEGLSFPVRLFAPLNLNKGTQYKEKELAHLDLDAVIELANKNKIALVLPNASSVLRSETEKFLLHLKVQPLKVIECNTSSGIVHLIERGFAMGFAPTPSLLDFKMGSSLHILGPPGGFWNHKISVLVKKGEVNKVKSVSPLADIFSPEFQES